MSLFKSLLFASLTHSISQGLGIKGLCGMIHSKINFTINVDTMPGSRGHVEYYDPCMDRKAMNLIDDAQKGHRSKC